MYTVLFADDNGMIRELCCGVLRRAGYRVLEAENGDEALSLARRHRGEIDLLITDIVMPRMSGLALRRAFAEFRAATPVLFISGNSESTIVGDPFLAKPFTPAELLSSVTALLARHLPAAAASRTKPVQPA